MATMELDRLAKELRRHKAISEFIITRRQTIRGFDSRSGGERRGGQLTDDQTQVRVFVDSRDGRGEARIAIADPSRAKLRAQLESATQLARDNRGPLWSLPPSAAPARVKVEDAAIAGDERGAAENLVGRARRIAGASAAITAWTETETVRVMTSSGFDNRYRATRVGLEAVIGDERRERVELGARALAALGADEAIGAALARTREPATEATPAGRFSLLVAPDATGPLPERSILGPLVALASARAFRLGLSRARPGDRVSAPGFTLRSDGAIDMALFSRPFDEDGAPTRRFSIIEDGVIANLALPLREAALLGREPNGGVCNLELWAPVASPDQLGRGPVLEVQRFDWLQADAATGGITAQIGRGELTMASGEKRSVAGGILRASDEALFATPLGSRTRIRRGWYRGPALLRLGEVEVR